MSDATYRIKPLEWRLVRDNEEEGAWWTASTVFGNLDVERSPGEGCRWRYCFDEYYDEGNLGCESIEAGKADAERFYLDRLLPALEAL